MRVHDRFHVGTYAVDAAMQVALERRVAFALDLIRFEVDDADVIDRKPAALARTDVDQDAVVVETDTAMAVVVDDVGLLEHADAVDQLLLAFSQRRGFLPVLHCGL
jgi:hypothetical protein